jgi:hypothetical protein
MIPVIATIASLASTLVTGDRVPDTGDLSTRATTTANQAEAGAQVIYGRGKSEFAQTLDKVEPVQAALDLLHHSGKLASPDAMASLQTLLQAAASSPSSTQPTSSMAQLQQSLQAGGERLREASRVGLDLKF